MLMQFPLARLTNTKNELRAVADPALATALELLTDGVAFPTEAGGLRLEWRCWGGMDVSVAIAADGLVTGIQIKSILLNP